MSARYEQKIVVSPKIGHFDRASAMHWIQAVPYNISAHCKIGPILSRRVQPQRAVRQARDYHRLGYTDITITEVQTGQVYDANSLAATIRERLAAIPDQAASGAAPTKSTFA